MAADILLTNTGPDPIIGFHLQQPAEKMLKALLVTKGSSPPRKHDMVLLRQLLQDAGIRLPPEFEELDLLEPYAAQARYGDAVPGSRLAIHRAQKLVATLREWTNARLLPTGT